MIVFEGAQDTAYNMGWSIASEMTPDKELSDGDSLVRLRNRVDQLIRDDLIAAGIQQAFINNIVGAGPNIRSDSDNRIQRKQINTLLDAQLRTCSSDGVTSLNQILEQIVAWSFAHGDILINLPLDSKRQGVKTVVELISASRIKTPSNKYNKEKDLIIRNGVEYYEDGRVKGYWVKKYKSIDKHADHVDNFDFYPLVRTSGGVSRRVTWLFKAPLNQKPTASRQPPVLTPVISYLKHLKDYREAILVGARVAACFSAFVKSNNPASAIRGFTSDSTGATTYNPAETRKVTKLQPGQIFYMRPNEDISFASPNKPSDNEDAYILRIYKTISMYVRMAYPLLFLDASDVNYSSWRGSALETLKTVARWRRDLSEVVQWLVETIVFEAMTLSLVRGDLSEINLRKRWPIPGILDREKEARADKLDLQNGITSKQKISDERGESYEEIQQERLEERKFELRVEAELLAEKKNLAEEYDIEWPDDLEREAKQDRETKRRPGEKEGKDLDEDDAKERRKEDGNY
jgi:capsid protein